MATSAAALLLAGCPPRGDRSTPERMVQTCFSALQRGDRAELRRCYSRNWPLDEVLAKKPAEYERYRREVLQGSTVEIAERRPSPDGDPNVLFIVPRYHRPDGGVEEDAALWTELRRIDGQWVIQAEHNDLFE
ncbi:MAG: hypothetical protein ACXWLM_07725 [Myxococcales bacterium]